MAEEFEILAMVSLLKTTATSARIITKVLATTSRKLKLRAYITSAMAVIATPAFKICAMIFKTPVSVSIGSAKMNYRTSADRFVKEKSGIVIWEVLIQIAAHLISKFFNHLNGRVVSHLDFQQNSAGFLVVRPSLTGQ